MTGKNKRGTSGGGIWGPGGASIDPATNIVYIATGNADTKTAPQQQQNGVYAEQVIALGPKLWQIRQHNYPSNIPNRRLGGFRFWRDAAAL